MQKKGKLIISRHQESEWNKVGKWTGLRDRRLTERGFKESEEVGFLIKDVKIDYAFASMQVRSIETLSCILNICEQYDIPTEHSAALNERDYGDYTAKNKWDMEKILGEEEYEKLRRGWDYPVPNGETLKMVYARVVPYFLEKILVKVNEGQNVLVVGHGNSLRALIKYIEKISDDDVINLEMPFGTVILYDLDNDGHAIHKEIRQTEREKHPNEMYKKAQIIASIGPASCKHGILKVMLDNGLDAIRLNFSWGDLETRLDTISIVRKIEKETGKHIPIIIDLPGPRVQEKTGHTYDHDLSSIITERDKEFIKFGVEHNVDYFALSFVGSEKDIFECKKYLKHVSGTQKIIAKIERKLALDNLEQIVVAADAVMVARGDLGNEIPLEQIPFVQENIIKVAKSLNKPVIVATQMLFSMIEHSEPTRAEVTDVDTAILQGADAVMLSDETTIGKYPVEAVSMMEKIILEAEKHITEETKLNLL